jgi:hypothetical protein
MLEENGNLLREINLFIVEDIDFLINYFRIIIYLVKQLLKIVI